jgi:recombination protein RecT
MGRDLAQRAAAQRNGNGQNGGGEQAERVRTLAGQLERMIPQYQAAMPKGREATQLVRDATTCLRTIKNLDKCDAESFLGALMTCAQLDLRPGVASLGHAWPLPYWDGQQRQYRAQLVVGYKGYIELGYRSGKLAGIASRIVYEGEEFDIEYHEDGDRLLHKPSYRGMRGAPVCFYSVARVVGGGYSLTEPMSVEEMTAHRDKYAPRNANGKMVGPWVDHFLPMGKKTMVLRNFAMLPKSAEMLSAMQVDNGVRVDLTPGADAGEVTEPVARVVAGAVEPDDGLADTEADSGMLPVEDPPDWPEVTRPGTGQPKGD